MENPQGRKTNAVSWKNTVWPLHMKIFHPIFCWHGQRNSRGLSTERCGKPNRVIWTSGQLQLHLTKISLIYGVIQLSVFCFNLKIFFKTIACKIIFRRYLRGKFTLFRDKNSGRIPNILKNCHSSLCCLVKDFVFTSFFSTIRHSEPKASYIIFIISHSE